jgi:beta-hydroxylase
MFDETYIHTAENRTDVTRVILFRMICSNMIKAIATQNMPSEHVGVLNRVFEYAYTIRILGDWRGVVRSPGVKPGSCPARSSCDI